MFGHPTAILSDNGPQFISETFKNYNQQIGTKQKFSTPYYPETNGQVERLHRYIKERLTLISLDLGMNFVECSDDWDTYISFIQHSYNSTPNAMTKYSPNKIIFGRELKIASDRINDNQMPSNLPSEYIRIMNNKRVIINNKVQRTQLKYDFIRSRSYNKGKYDPLKYGVGDLVLVNIERRFVGNKKKFTPVWIGPYEIIKIVDRMVVVRDIGNENDIQEIYDAKTLS